MGTERDRDSARQVRVPSVEITRGRRSDAPGSGRPSALATDTFVEHPDFTEPERLFVMLDRATDHILSICAGPADDGKYLVGVRGTPARGISLTADAMTPGLCPLAGIDEPVAAPQGA
jgi:hypothetical protein